MVSGRKKLGKIAMFGRVVRSLICIGGVMSLSPERASEGDIVSLAKGAGRQAAAQAQTACAADLARCAPALAAVGLVAGARPRASQDTLSLADRAAAAHRRGG